MKAQALRAYVFRGWKEPMLFRSTLEFRKHVFIDRLGWKLNISDGVERDDFDHAWAINCALMNGSRVVGAFRAIRCDRPYLSARIFPTLAAEPYPSTWDAWEISRFAALERASWPLYAAMLNFGWTRQVRALVALVVTCH